MGGSLETRGRGVNKLLTYPQLTERAVVGYLEPRSVVMSPLKKRVGFFLLFAVCVPFFSACIRKQEGGLGTGKGAVNQVLLLGEFGTMTGPESTFGLSTHNGIVMAIEEANAENGIRGMKIQLKSYDDEGRSDKVVAVVTRLVTQDKVVLLLGEVASSRSIAAASIAQQFKIPMLSPSSTNPRVTEIGDYIFRACFIDPFQGSVMARFARNHLKLRTAAILRDVRSDYSVGLANVFAKEFKKLGGSVLADLPYFSGDFDFKSQLRTIKLKKPDLIFVPGYYSEVGLIARQAKNLNYKGVLLGGDGWDSDKLVKIAGDAILGGYFSSHYSSKDKNPVVQNFVSKYKAKFGTIPNGLSAMGYDAARVAIEAARNAVDLSPKSLRDALAKTKNFSGVTGIITLNDERNAVKPAVVLRVVGRSEYDFVTTVNP